MSTNIVSHRTQFYFGDYVTQTWLDFFNYFLSIYPLLENFPDLNFFPWFWLKKHRFSLIFLAGKSFQNVPWFPWSVGTLMICVSQKFYDDTTMTFQKRKTLTNVPKTHSSNTQYMLEIVAMVIAFAS